jgi:hypothetical protein
VIQGQFLSKETLKKVKNRFNNPLLVTDVKQLSRDHKPDDPEEADHILKSGGRIDSYRNG